MKSHGQGNFWWMVWGGKRRKKKHDQTILVERADRLQRSCTSEKAFLLIFPCHIPRRQHVLYVCAFSSAGKHCSAHWGASKLGHGVRQKPPFGWPLRWRFPLPYHSPPFPTMPFSPLFAHFGHLYCNPQAPNSPSGLSNVYVFSLALQLSLGDHPLSRGSKSGRVSHLKLCGESQGRDIHGRGERPDASLNPGLLHDTHRGDWAKMGRKPQGTKT